MNAYRKRVEDVLARLDKMTVNRINAAISIVLFGTGLILFLKFHVGGGAYRKEFFGLGKFFWLTLHQMAAIAFLVGLCAHVWNNNKYIWTIVTRWRSSLSEKMKRKSVEQAVLLAVGLCVIFAGFYPWIMMPGAPLRGRGYHAWIDAHNYFGIAFMIGSFVHVSRRWRRLVK